MDGLSIVFTIWTVQCKLCQNCTKKANVEFSWRLKHKYNYRVDWFRFRLKDKPSIAYALPRPHYFSSLISFHIFFFSILCRLFAIFTFIEAFFFTKIYWCATTTSQKSFNSLTFHKQLDYSITELLNMKTIMRRETYIVSTLRSRAWELDKITSWYLYARGGPTT